MSNTVTSNVNYSIEYRDGEYIAIAAGGVEISRHKGYGAALRAASNDAVSRAHRPTSAAVAISYPLVKAIKEAGMLGEWLAELTNDQIETVAGILVAANAEAGRETTFADALACLYAVLDRHARGTDMPAEGDAPRLVGHTAGYEKAHGRIVIRYGGKLVGVAATFIDVAQWYTDHAAQPHARIALAA